jgi:hypothetical protein
MTIESSNSIIKVTIINQRKKEKKKKEKRKKEK